VNEQDIQNALQTLLREIALMSEKQAVDAGMPNALVNLRMARTFEEVGLLTANAGVVIVTCDGSEFQLTIVKSR
jgi:hypothetical protein